MPARRWFARLGRQAGRQGGHLSPAWLEVRCDDRQHAARARHEPRVLSGQGRGWQNPSRGLMTVELRWVQAMNDVHMKPAGWKQKLVHEMVEYYLNFVYLAFFLVAFTWYRRLTLAEYNIHYLEYWVPLVEAAVL